MGKKADAVRYPNVRAKTETSSVSSASVDGLSFGQRQLDSKIAKAGKIEPIKEDWALSRARTAITLTQREKTLVTFRGAHPPLADALCEICTIHPEWVMYREDDTNPYYRIDISAEELLYYATDNEPFMKGYFWAEILKLAARPRAWAVSYGNGKGDIVTIYNIIPHFEELPAMSAADAARCRNIKAERRVVSFTIFFYRWLFKACIDPEGEGGGFLTTDHAFYTKLMKALRELELGRTEDSRQFLRLYNPKKIAVLKEEKRARLDATLYKLVIWFLIHAEPKAGVLFDHAVRKDSGEVIEMLRQVDPGMLRRPDKDAREYIRDKIDAQILIDKACMMLNCAARAGDCEHVKAVPVETFYRDGKGKNDFTIEIAFAANSARGEAKSMRKIPPYTSSLQAELFRQNPAIDSEEGPLELDF